jgi:hypothetical protein
MSERLTLSDILGRGVSMEWYEGVALVRGVASRLTEASNPAAVPELHQIEVSDAGDIYVTGGAVPDEPVRRMGQLLQATLGHTEAPVQLRLVIVQATAPAPVFGSIREYDDALGYFERPGRNTVLQALYARAAAAAPAASAEKAPTLDVVAPLPTTEQPKAPRRKKANAKPNALKIAVTAGIILFIGAASAWYATGSSFADGTEVSAIARQASDAVEAAVVSGLSAVTERSGLGRLVPTGASEANVAAPSAPVEKRPRAKRASPPEEHPDVPIIFFDLDPVPNAGAGRVVAIDSMTPLADTTGEEAQFKEERIFSADSQGVSPPIGVRPQLPRELPANLKPEQLTRLEVVVSEAGTVDSVKLLGAPRTVHDFMFLSAAKAWLFQPALKDGNPVRYRKTIWLVSR